MADHGDRRGILYPTRLPTFHREPAPDELTHLIRWFWIPQWDIAPGRVSRQTLLPFPASNLVVEGDRVTLSGPASGIAHRDLTGSGWAVGALLRPAAAGKLTADARLIRDLELPFAAPDLQQEVSEVMNGADRPELLGSAVEAFCNWATRSIGAPDDAALLANTMEDLVATDRSMVRVDQLAKELGISIRGLQRLAGRYFGLPPLTIIRRYRLQEAAQSLREDKCLTIAQVAADLGYADHAHLCADFRQTLGFTPHSYRDEARHPGRDSGS